VETDVLYIAPQSGRIHQEDGMAKGREKDRKTRMKHRKNIKRMKALAKSRRMKRGKQR
jgi:hypothetical protein